MLIQGNLLCDTNFVVIMSYVYFVTTLNYTIYEMFPLWQLKILNTGYVPV